MSNIADRPNEDRAQVIERGISIQALRGSRSAAEFLRANNVPFRTIVRVLADEKRRRAAPKNANFEKGGIRRISELKRI